MERDELELIEKFNYDFLSATRIGLDFPVTMHINDETHNAIIKLLNEYKKLNKKIDLMEDYMVENGYEICFDHIYGELNNCNGMYRDWCRGDELEKRDIHEYFERTCKNNE